MRDYLANGGGADLLIDALHALAKSDPALRDYLANGGASTAYWGGFTTSPATTRRCAIIWCAARWEMSSASIYPQALADERGRDGYLASTGHRRALLAMFMTWPPVLICHWPSAPKVSARKARI